jgi:hypothetical protein
LQQLKEMKNTTREKRKAYWAQHRNNGQQPIEGGCPGKGQSEIVNPRANTEAVFNINSRILQMRVPKTKNDSLHSSILSH